MPEAWDYKKAGLDLAKVPLKAYPESGPLSLQPAE